MAPRACARCGAPVGLDLAHFIEVCRAAGLVDRQTAPLEALLEAWTRGTLVLPVPVLSRCSNGHMRAVQPPPRRGRYVPICEVCEQPVFERTLRGHARRYHAVCAPKAGTTGARVRGAVRWIWAPAAPGGLGAG